MTNRRGFEHQVGQEKLISPVDVGIFYHGRFWNSQRIANKKRIAFCEKLNTAGIDFSIVKHLSLPQLAVSIEEENLPKMEKAGIFREIYDPR